MPDSLLAKAKLIELDSNFKPKSGGKEVTVQFNPETLKVSFANQVTEAKGANPNTGPTGRQFVGQGTTKLSMQLWFDVTAPAAGQSQADDVRDLTKEVIYFITLKKDDQGNDMLPPPVRFEWGTFAFQGMVDSIEESLEFFSREGRPLRAGVSMNMSQQRVEVLSAAAPAPPGAGPAPGTQPLTPAPAGATLQGLAAAAGTGVSWQDIAQANGIENPRLLAPGQLVNLNVSASASVRL